MIDDVQLRLDEAQAALNSGDYQAAAAILEASRTAYGDHPGLLAGLAFLATQRARWNEAAALWDRCIQRFPDAFTDEWQLVRARVLAEVGRSDEVIPICLQVAERSPHLALRAAERLWTVFARARSYRNGGRVARELLTSRDSSLPIEVTGARLLGYAQDVAAARELLDRAIGKATSPVEIELVALEIPMLFEGADRHGRLSRLLLALQRSASPADAEPVRLHRRIVEAKLRLAIGDLRGVLTCLDALPTSATHRHLPPLLALAARLRSPSFPDFAAPKVFGIGLSKTGTSSLTKALQLLGLSAIHWTNPLTNSLIDRDDLFLHDALLDTPITYNFEHLYYAFPNSKFIYTVRPLGGWKRSFRKFFAHQYGEELQLPRKTGVPVAHFWYGRLQETIHQTLYFSHATLDDAYNAFEDRVTRFFADKPSERFLRLNLFAGDSWPKLCGFLGVPVPDVPFPWENRFASPQKG